ncbi:Imm1 family immunity protein [Kitasatospora sp. NPDC096128]|uniref:Imm1 family immunity protein n=1 Tax=Kitasatospora sp. NPDC096128 TaxID=3155547 RepID=UPI003316594C
MILNAHIRGQYYHAESWPEKAELIADVMENLRFERADAPWVSAGECAEFSFANQRRTEASDWWPDNHLQISVNSATGFGGLVWFVMRDDAPEGDISEHIWISDNPNPPDFDPRVVADPGIPHFFDPRSAIPTEDVRAALEEFCRKSTGDRPECIQWVHGDMDGQRNEG